MGQDIQKAICLANTEESYYVRKRESFLFNTGRHNELTLVINLSESNCEEQKRQEALRQTLGDRILHLTRQGTCLPFPHFLKRQTTAIRFLSRQNRALSGKGCLGRASSDLTRHLTQLQPTDPSTSLLLPSVDG